MTLSLGLLSSSNSSSSSSNKDASSLALLAAILITKPHPHVSRRFSPAQLLIFLQRSKIKIKNYVFLPDLPSSFAETRSALLVANFEVDFEPLAILAA